MNNAYNLLNIAINIAAAAHAGHVDKGGKPYILHPMRVMMKMKGVDEMAAAVLHDVVEDTEWDMDRLRNAGIPDRILHVIDLLTKKPGYNYNEYIAKIASDPIAVAVKLADLEDNMNVARLPILTDADIARLAKYHKAYVVLKNL